MGQLAVRGRGWHIIKGICYGLLLCGLTGCGAGSSDNTSTTTTTAQSDASASGSAPASSNSESDKAVAPGKATPPAIPRKIIYDATVDLIAENLTTAQQKLLRIVKHYNGYLMCDSFAG